MDNNNIKVSVIMPVYNSGEYLKTAVESILNQSLKEIELILVDDGSTDGSSERCDEYAAKDSRVVVIHQKNGGICNARNAALKIARGEYIGFSDHDDEYLPGLLENAYNRITEDRSDVLKFCKRELVMLNNVVVRTKETHLEDKIYNKDEIKDNIFQLLNGKVLECVWDGLFKKSFMMNNQIQFDEFYKSGGEDIDILMKIMTKANSFSTMGTIYYVHYIRSGFSTSSKFNQKKLDMCEMLGRRITEGLSCLGINIEGHKVDYVCQIMFSYINGATNIMANPLCTFTESDKLNRIAKFKKSEFLPSWFCSVSSFRVFRNDKKLGISYFLFKHGMYKAMLSMFRSRQKQMEMKAKI